MIDYRPSKASQMLRSLSCIHNEVNKAKKELCSTKDKAEKDMACKKAAIFCFEKFVGTNSLSINYSNERTSQDYTSIANDIHLASNNEDMFNEHLSRFGLKFECRKH